MNTINFKRYTIAYLLFASLNLHAATTSFDTSDSDSIVIGATAEKVNLRVTGFKNLASQGNIPWGFRLGNFYITTSSDTGSLAVTYGPEHDPKMDGKYFVGKIKNEEGHTVKTTMSVGNFTYGSVKVIDGTNWYFFDGTSTSKNMTGEIIAVGGEALSVGVYPITLRAALYLP